MKQIYICTQQAEENRVIIVHNGKVVGYEQERLGEENRKGNIYKGVVSLVEAGLDAAFVDIGEHKNGLLPLREIPPDVFGRPVKEGDQILVQIKKDHTGDKGAGLTGYISLAGHFLVLQPKRRNVSMISKHGSHEERQEMREKIQSLNIPDGMGVIVRTAGLGATEEELRWDLESYLLKLWEKVETVSEKITEPTLIYRENNLIPRIVRDYFRPLDGDRIHCDDLDSYRELEAFISLVFPDCAESVHYYDGKNGMIPAPIEDQIDQIFSREVTTPSGVRVVFDSTEALVAVDVNSGRLRGGADIEETALRANMEAAEVIALQLRLRNLAGLVVIDFIDMDKEDNRRRLERHFQQLVRNDRARIRCSNVSQFGLMEVSRQRLSRALSSSQVTTCPHCNGYGQVWRTETFASRLLRKINAVAESHQGKLILLEAPSDVAIYILNEKRTDVRQIEDNHDCGIVIIPNEQMAPPQFTVKPVSGHVNSSHHLMNEARKKKVDEWRERLISRETPHRRDSVIEAMQPGERSPKADGDQSGGLSKRLGRAVKTLLGMKSEKTGGDGKSKTPAEAKKSAHGRKSAAKSANQNASQKKRAGQQPSERRGRKSNRSGQRAAGQSSPADSGQKSPSAGSAAQSTGRSRGQRRRKSAAVAQSSPEPSAAAAEGKPAAAVESAPPKSEAKSAVKEQASDAPKPSSEPMVAPPTESAKPAPKEPTPPEVGLKTEEITPIRPPEWSTHSEDEPLVRARQGNGESKKGDLGGQSAAGEAKPPAQNEQPSSPSVDPNVKVLPPIYSGSDKPPPSS